MSLAIVHMAEVCVCVVRVLVVVHAPACVPVVDTHSIAVVCELCACVAPRGGRVKAHAEQKFVGEVSSMVGVLRQLDVLLADAQSDDAHAHESAQVRGASFGVPLDAASQAEAAKHVRREKRSITGFS